MDASKPHFELTNVYDDGSQDEPQIVPVSEFPWEARSSRRGFLGTGISVVAMVAMSKIPKVLNGQEVNAQEYAAYGPKVLKAHAGEVYAVAFSPDGKLLATGSDDKTVKLWQMPEGKKTKTLTGHYFGILSVAYSPDGKLLASGSLDNSAKLWEMPEGTLAKTQTGHTLGVRSVAFSPKGDILALGSWDKTVNLWQMPDGILSKTLKGHSSYIESVAFSPDGKFLASGSSDKMVKLWQVPDGKLAKTLTGHLGEICCVAFSPDGKLLASGAADKTINLWQMPEGKLVKTLKGHSSDVRTVSFSPDGSLLASGSRDATVNLWQMPGGTLIKTLTGHSGDVGTVAFSPDGNLLASGSADKTVRLWELSNSEVFAFLFDPDINSDNAISFEVFHKETGRTITYTLPCGSPIPAGATCICNCIGGTYKEPEKPTPAPKKATAPTQSTPIRTTVPTNITAPRRTGTTTRTTTRTYCSCNKVCTCVPVCQAHNLLHPDSNVRVMAEEILLLMGKKELGYMQWAAKGAETPALKECIHGMMNAIKKGARPHPERWPSMPQCLSYLDNEDPVVGIMAAQMIQQLAQRQRIVLPAWLLEKSNALFRKADEMHWLKKAGLTSPTCLVLK